MTIISHKKCAIIDRRNTVKEVDTKCAAASMDAYLAKSVPEAEQPDSESLRPGNTQDRSKPIPIGCRVETQRHEFYWCPGRDLNPHSTFAETDFKSVASAGFATRAI